MASGGNFSRVKNKAPAAVQITAEQLLREAWDNKEVDEGGSGAPAAPRAQIADKAEVRDYQEGRRKEFETRIVFSRGHTPLWLRYARWEEAQRDFERARSVYERAVDNDYRVTAVWLAYAEMEMRHRFINRARNVWDRAVTCLPRVPVLWVKYAFMEEVLGNVEIVRVVYGRWMAWRPEVSAYLSYVRFEERYGTVEHARAVYEALVAAHPSPRTYLKFADFEERHACVGRARVVYEVAATDVPGMVVGAAFYIAFAKFEERMREPERARAIYEYAAGKKGLSQEDVASILEAHTVFEKQRGGRQGVEAVVLTKKRAAYEKRLAADGRDYDAWFDLLRLEEGAAVSVDDGVSVTEVGKERVRRTYDRAVAEVPLVGEKEYWRRYIYLWLGYAVWEELDAGDMERAAQVFQRCLATIPDRHRRFSFGKVWMLASKLEIRRHRPEAARQLLGNALGVLPHKDSLYRGYISIERSLGAIDRMRTLYMLWLERNPTATVAFIEFADMEATDLNEITRARDILEVGVQSAHLDQPEALWKAYIDFEAGQGEVKRVVALYERLISKVSSVKVWLAFGKFMEEQESGARQVYSRGDRALKDRIVEYGRSVEGMDGPAAAAGSAAREAAAADRVRLLDAWISWEERISAEGGDGTSSEHLKLVQEMMPKRIKKRRAVTDARGVDAGWEEYYEYVFPEEQEVNPKLKILEAARKWKLQRQKAAAEAQQA